MSTEWSQVPTVERRWTRSTREQRCGKCGRAVLRGQPLLLVAGRGQFQGDPCTWTLRRCGDCAGEPVPANLPVLEPPAPIAAAPFVAMRTGPDCLPLDFKAKAAGEP